MIRRTLHLMLACAALAPWHPASAANFHALYQFNAPGDASLDGANPYAGLVRDEAGNPVRHAPMPAPPPGLAAFSCWHRQANGGWAETLIHSFSTTGGADGAHPLGSLILGPAGVLYGTTSTGGGPGNAGGGTVFALRPPLFPGAGWTETVLTVFPGKHGTGGAPAAHLLLDASGALYGTTTMGGTGAGSVFRLAPPAPGQANWMRTDLHVFGGSGDGQTPISALDGGCRRRALRHGPGQRRSAKRRRRRVPPGAPARRANGPGTETILFTFPASGTFGSMPNGDLLMDKSGALYGTASAGGNKGAGTVFRLARAGAWPGLALHRAA